MIPKSRDGFALELVAMLRRRYVGKPIAVDFLRTTSDGPLIRVTAPTGEVFNCTVTTARPEGFGLPRKEKQS